MTQLKWQYIQLPCWCEIKPYIDSNKEIKNKDHRFIINDTVIISKYKSVFAKGYTPNWSEEGFLIKKVKNTVPWTYIVSGLNREDVVGTV